jgi:hypothetical protein
MICGGGLLIGEHWTRWHLLGGSLLRSPQTMTLRSARGLEHLERLEVKGELCLWK